jgi:hypothetical protein
LTVITVSHSFACAAALLFAAGAAQAHIEVFTATLTGPGESPPNPSPGTGFTETVIDPDTFHMTVHVEFAGLTGTTTASHIHGPTAVPGTGVAGVMTPTPTFPGFPLGVTSGTYDHDFDMTLASSYNPAFLSAQGGDPLVAFSALFGAVEEGRAYLNIHSSTFGGGEIRGFLTLVPAPGAAGLVALGGLVASRRRRS